MVLGFVHQEKSPVECFVVVYSCTPAILGWQRLESCVFKGRLGYIVRPLFSPYTKIKEKAGRKGETEGGGRKGGREGKRKEEERAEGGSKVENTGLLCLSGPVRWK